MIGLDWRDLRAYFTHGGWLGWVMFALAVLAWLWAFQASVGALINALDRRQERRRALARVDRLIAEELAAVELEQFDRGFPITAERVWKGQHDFWVDHLEPADRGPIHIDRFSLAICAKQLLPFAWKEGDTVKFSGTGFLGMDGEWRVQEIHKDRSVTLTRA